VQPWRLLLIRHAEAASGAVDLDRPLTEHGVRQASAIGAWLAGAGLVPDRVLVSPARRAQQTWERVAATLTTAPTPTVDGRIYDNTVTALLEAVRDSPEDVRALAVIGHNPSVRELMTFLDDGEGSPEAERVLDRTFPAAGVAVFHLAAPLAGAAPGAATLSDAMAPSG
jgi:phosphohistidine phosphatase